MSGLNPQLVALQNEIIILGATMRRMENLLKKIVYAAELFSNPSFVVKDFSKIKEGDCALGDVFLPLREMSEKEWTVGAKVTFADIYESDVKVNVGEGDE